jgi:hypothetical protein
MKNKDSINKNQTEKKKLPPDASAIAYDRDKNLTYRPKDESVEPPEHLAAAPPDHFAAAPPKTPEPPESPDPDKEKETPQLPEHELDVPPADEPKPSAIPKPQTPLGDRPELAK